MYQVWSFDSSHHQLHAEADDPGDVLGVKPRPGCLGAIVLHEDERVVALADGSTAYTSGHSGFDLGPDAIVSGLVADIARRSMGQPTAPERHDTSWLLISIWLTALLHVVADPETAPSRGNFATFAALHPCATSSTQSPADVVEATIEFSKSFDWRTIHALTGLGSIPNLSDLSVGLVSWMDTPMFARWILARYRPVTELLDDLSLFVSRNTLHEVESAAGLSLGVESWRMIEGGR